MTNVGTFTNKDMEDYEKKYNEALAKAKDLRDGFEGYNANVAIIEQIFPELKESEDERIRKHIIEIFNNLSPCHFDGNEKGECIAWLEKHKEQPITVAAEKKEQPISDGMMALAAEEVLWEDDNPNGSEDGVKTPLTLISDLIRKEQMHCTKDKAGAAYSRQLEWAKYWLEEISSQGDLTREQFIKFGNLEYERGRLDGINETRWKPTKAQLDALFTASDRNDRTGSILHSLYTALKNLK